LPERGDRDSSLALLRALGNDFPDNVVLLEPARFPGGCVTTTTEIKGLRIATKPQSKSWQGRWIEFLHDCADSEGGEPVYRVYGNRHILTEPKHRAHYPGSQFVRSSASDNGHTDVGPRHVLVLTINSSGNAPDVRRERLPVKEVAVLKRARTRGEWSLVYERDYQKSRWKTTKPPEGSIALVVDYIRRSYPAVEYVTLIVPDEDRTVQQSAMMLGRSIVASRPGIISLSLNH
jgi:hypothetical protein